LLCVDIKEGFWRGLGGGGGPFWLHRETLTFVVPAAFQNTGVPGRTKFLHTSTHC